MQERYRERRDIQKKKQWTLKGFLEEKKNQLENYLEKKK